MRVVRRLGPGDEALAARLATLSGQPIAAAIGLNHVVELLADRRTFVLAAFDGGEPVGLAMLHELPRLDGPKPKLLIYSVDIAPSHRRQGYGRALIEAAKQVGRDRGCRSMWLLTNASNQAAMGLYVATGAHREHADDVMLSWNLE